VLPTLDARLSDSLTVYLVFTVYSTVYPRRNLSLGDASSRDHIDNLPATLLPASETFCEEQVFSNYKWKKEFLVIIRFENVDNMGNIAWNIVLIK